MDIKVGRYGINEGSVRYLPGHDVVEEKRRTDAGEKYELRDGKMFVGGEQIGYIERMWQGWVEDAEKTWLVFIDKDGHPLVFLNRCQKCGGVLADPHPEGIPFFCYRSPDCTPIAGSSPSV